MGTIEFKEIVSEDVWESFLREQEDASFLQSWYWGEFQSSLGKKIIRRGVFVNDALVGVYLLILENARRGRHLILPAGPLVSFEDIDFLKNIVSDIRMIAKKEGAVFVRVRPQLLGKSQNRELFKKLGFIPAPLHLHAELTTRLDVRPDTETILKNMRKQTRYEINKSEKIGIAVETDISEGSIKNFYEHQLETSRRQKFVPFSREFLTNQFKIFSDKGLATLYRASFEGHTLAEAFVIFYKKEAVYHYGASTEYGRKYPGAYAIQWKIIQDAKERGMNYYNLWGVAREGDTKHRFYPISIFKRGFGGVDVEYLHAHDLIISWPRYFVNFLIEYARKLTRRL